MVFNQVLTAGNAFGELALRYDSENPDKVVRRAATITAIEETVFALVEKKDYRRILDKIEEKIVEESSEFF